MLSLNYLQSGSAECPLLRIAGVDPEACIVLADALRCLAERFTNATAIHELPGIMASGECKLYAKNGARDEGIVQANSDTFLWTLNPDSWDNVVGLLEPFRDGSTSGYQWLEQSGHIRLLITTTGKW